ncbi:Transcriptional enhancer factor TEF-1 [Mortierella alpina]|nr:Transcriptional enhancer factor TEF-1 [Mortierella alpina]
MDQEPHPFSAHASPLSLQSRWGPPHSVRDPQSSPWMPQLRHHDERDPKDDSRALSSKLARVKSESFLAAGRSEAARDTRQSSPPIGTQHYPHRYAAEQPQPQPQRQHHHLSHRSLSSGCRTVSHEDLKSEQDQLFQQQQRHHHNQPQRNLQYQSHQGPSLATSSGANPLLHQQQQHSSYQHHSHSYNQQPQAYDGHGHMLSTSVPAAQRSMLLTKRRSIKEKAPKGDREEVWPPDVEKAFMEVMRLLMDGGDGDEDVTPESLNMVYYAESQSPMASPLPSSASDQAFLVDRLQQVPDDHAFSAMDAQGYDRSIRSHNNKNNSFSDSMAHRANSPYYGQSSHNHEQQNYVHHQQPSRTDSSMGDILGDRSLYYDQPTSRCASTQSLYQQAATTPDSAVSLSSEPRQEDHAFSQCARGPVQHQPVQYPGAMYPLWPTIFGLYTKSLPQGTPPRDGDSLDQESDQHAERLGHAGSTASAVRTHELAQAKDLSRHAFGAVNIHQLPAEKFPHLYDLYQKASCAFLFFKINMDLGLELEGSFENTCRFESTERRTVRCSTLIYSFGSSVLESTEVKQATVVNGKYTHSFEFVNQFFNAFLGGIRTLGTSEEVEVALGNLSMVQVFEDMDPRSDSSPPLLVMAYDFEQGRGQVAPYVISDNSEISDAIVC